MWATFIKEFKIIWRDPVGFLLLLIMPGILIVVMAVTQDSSFKDLQDVEFEVHVANLDQGKVGTDIVRSIDESDKFKVIAVSDTLLLKENVAAGKYKVGVIIPAKATTALVNLTNKMANNVSAQSGMPTFLSQNDSLGALSVALFFDPSLKPALKNGFRFALAQYTTQVKMDALMARMDKMSNSSGSKGLSADIMALLALEEAEGVSFKQTSMPLNSVQHNVPSWAIFAMFLIVVPIAGNMLREREEGSQTRIRLIPGALPKATLGTLLFYVLICTLQFYLLLMIGVYLLPAFDLPRLYMGEHPILSLPLVLATAFAATSYGYFIGSVFKTANQAMPVGAISVVILASIGGIWVPLEILPKLMTNIANFTPLYWSFNGINNLFIRGLTWTSTLPYIGYLLVFGSVLSLLSVWVSQRQHR